MLRNLRAYRRRPWAALAANDQFADVLPITEPALGPEHTDSVTDRSNLAYRTTAAQGSA